jgi:hypothetical protein
MIRTGRCSIRTIWPWFLTDRKFSCGPCLASDASYLDREATQYLGKSSERILEGFVSLGCIFTRATRFILPYRGKSNSRSPLPV